MSLLTRDNEALSRVRLLPALITDAFASVVLAPLEEIAEQAAD
jgi:site-specific recombinase XerD